jgi:Short C-terminal domain/Phospholipase_D-nuclease N-terminal
VRGPGRIDGPPTIGQHRLGRPSRTEETHGEKRDDAEDADHQISPEGALPHRDGPPIATRQGGTVLLAADYPFLEVMWTLIVFFAWVIWFWILITILADVFRRRDIGGGKKALWVVFLILVPFLGVLVYLIINHDEMAERNVKEAKASQAQFDEYVKSVAGGGATAEIERAKQLLDSGAISQAEFETIKAKALAS